MKPYSPALFTKTYFQIGSYGFSFYKNQNSIFGMIERHNHYL